MSKMIDAAIQVGCAIRSFRVEKLLGRGAFASVYRVRVSGTYDVYAMKVCHNQGRAAQLSKDEIAVLSHLKNHDPEGTSNCITLLRVFPYNYGFTCLVFPLLGKSLDSFLKNNHRLPFPRAHVQQIAYQLLSALAFVHSIGVVHCDVKSDNILLRTDTFFTSSYTQAGNVVMRNVLYNPQICLGDFGIAKIINDQKQMDGVRGPYIAPELCLALPWDYSVDVYAAGLVIQEIALGEPIIPPGATAAQTLALLHVFKGQLPQYLARHAQRETTIPFETFRTGSVLPCKRSTTHINFARLGLDRSKYNQMAIKCRQMDIDHALDMNSATYVALKDNLMEYDPERRLTAANALQHQYFTQARFPQPSVPY